MPKGVLDQKIFTFPPARVPVGERLRPALQQLLPALTTRQAIYAITNGMVRIDGKTVRNLDHGVPPDCTITLDLRHGVRGEGKPDRPPLIEQMRVVHDESAFVVVVKGTGVIVQPSQEEERGRHGPPLVELLKHYWKARREGMVNPILVQRLDKETSGLMVLAKTIPASRILQRQAGGREMERRYVAIVEGNVAEDSGTWQTWMGVGEDGLRQSVGTPEDEPPLEAREAITHYKVLQRVPGATLLELRLGTGRTHQIRIHCAEAGHPVVGDFVYIKLARQRHPRVTFGELAKSGRMMLHAARLKFRHPGDVDKWLTFEEPAPSTFGDYLKELMEAARTEPFARGPRRAWEDRGPENVVEAPAHKFRGEKPASAFVRKPRDEERPFSKGPRKESGGDWKPKKSFGAGAARDDRKGSGFSKSADKKPYSKGPRDDAKGASFSKGGARKPFSKGPAKTFGSASRDDRKGGGFPAKGPGGKKPFPKAPRVADNEWSEGPPRSSRKGPGFSKGPAKSFGAPSREDRKGAGFSPKPGGKKPFSKGPRAAGSDWSEKPPRSDKKGPGFSKGPAKSFGGPSRDDRKGAGFSPKPGGKKPFSKGPRPEKDWSDRPPRDEKKGPGFSKGPAKKFGSGAAGKPLAGKPSPWGKAAGSKPASKPAFKPRPGGAGPYKGKGPKAK